MNSPEQIRECDFVDNTAYIRQLESVDTPVFQRPKRFGRFVWCSVLALLADWFCIFKEVSCREHG